MNKKVLLRILAGFTAFFLIGILFYLLFSFTGNPVTAWIAERAMTQYVEEHYSEHDDWHIHGVTYNFKDDTYSILVESQTSPDTKFYVYYRPGEAVWDDYDFFVTEKQNTILRLENEYSRLAAKILAEELGMVEYDVRVLYGEDIYEAEFLELDMAFRRTLPVSSRMFISAHLDAPELEEVAKLLTAVHEAFRKHNCIFSEYDFHFRGEGPFMTISGVTPRHIESGNLAVLLEEAKIQDESGAIRVYFED